MSETFTSEQKLEAYRKVLHGIAAGDGDEPGSEEAARKVLADYGESEPPVTTDQAMELAKGIQMRANTVSNYIEGITDDLFKAAMEDSSTVVSSLKDARDQIACMLDEVVQLAEALGIPATIYSVEDKIEVWYTVEKVTSSSPHSAPVIEIGDVACSGS